MTRLLTIVVLCGGLALAQPATPTVDNQTVVDMVRSNVAVDLIITSIYEAENVNFNLFPTTLMAMTKAGVPDDVIRAMADRLHNGRRKGPVIPPAMQTQSGLAVSEPQGQVQMREVSGSNRIQQRSGTSVGPLPTSPTMQPGTLPPSPSIDGDEPPHYSGAKEINFAFSGVVPHASAGDSFRLIAARFGVSATRGHQFGADVSGIFADDLALGFLGGFYRYYVPTGERANPFFGAGAGAFVISSGGTESRFSAHAEGGVRVFVTSRVAIDIGYQLRWVDFDGAGFKNSTLSTISAGFAHVF